MTAERVTDELDGAVALIGLNRPDKRNAIDDAVVDAQHAAVLRAHDEANVGVLFGHGPNFCAGLDLAEALARATGGKPRPRKRKRHNWHVVFDEIECGPIPFVGALHGAVVGGGLELAMATHVRVADETAFFGLPEGQRGIFVGGGGTVRIQRVVGTTVMVDMMLTGRLLNPAEGLAEHVVRYVTPPGGALAKARDLAERIARNTIETNWKIVQVRRFQVRSATPAGRSMNRRPTADRDVVHQRSERFARRQPSERRAGSVVHQVDDRVERVLNMDGQVDPFGRNDGATVCLGRSSDGPIRRLSPS